MLRMGEDRRHSRPNFEENNAVLYPKTSRKQEKMTATSFKELEAKEFKLP